LANRPSWLVLQTFAQHFGDGFAFAILPSCHPCANERTKGPGEIPINTGTIRNSAGLFRVLCQN